MRPLWRSSYIFLDSLRIIFCDGLVFRYQHPPTAMLYCPNHTCQTPNPETNRFCHKCRAPLPKHYLRAIGLGADNCQSGTLLSDRYLCKRNHIFLDTKPGILPRESAEITPQIMPYLRLAAYRSQVPQVYAVVRSPSASGHSASQNTAQIALLNHVPIRVDATDVDGDIPPECVTLAPAILDEWLNATALRQLNWLWQLAHLWQPLSQEQVASTLLHPDLIRVEGSRLRLQELYLDGEDGEASPTLADFGRLWLPWAERAAPPLREGLTSLCQHLQQETIRNAELMVDYLDVLLAKVGRSHPRWVQIATLTDQGPSRQRNEDACYPPTGTVSELAIPAGQASQTDETSLVIVCDGIGGHQGGNVASQLAIDTVLQTVQGLDIDTLSPTALMLELEKAACAANDVISQRNDSERRFERQRMGTTLVIGLVRGHELYITHVGDSRAYWITQSGCQQVTLDDDVASREVRLGYGLYREALQQPGAGSLVQALGMGASNMLRPTVQRFILDEDSVFLLCSDGLSDNDRVEQYWDARILPILDGTADIGAIATQLVKLANTLNGHDNVTVGLIHCHVDQPRRGTQLKLPLPQVANPAAAARANQTAVVSPAAPSGVAGAPRENSPNPTAKTVLQTGTNTASHPTTVPTEIPDNPQSRPEKATPLWSLLLGILVLLGVGGALIYLVFPSVQESLGLLNPDPSPTPPPPESPTSDPATPRSPALGTFLQIQALPSTDPAQSTDDFLAFYPGEPPPESLDSRTLSLPVGAIVQVMSELPEAGVDPNNPMAELIKLRVCMTATDIPEPGAPEPGGPELGSPSADAPSPVMEMNPEQETPIPAKAPDQGWVLSTALQSRSIEISPDTLPANALEICTPPTTEPSAPSVDESPLTQSPGDLSDTSLNG